MFTNLEDIEKYCMDEGWGGFEEEAVSRPALETTALLLDYNYAKCWGLKVLDSGHIEATLEMSNKKDLVVVVGYSKHTVAFFSGEINIEKTFQNKHIRRTSEAIEGFETFYHYFY